MIALACFAILATGANPSVASVTSTHTAPSGQPQSATTSLVRLLITGDSITQGSSGDYTWRYRLWSKLQGTAPGAVQFVGTRTDLFDNVNGSFGSAYYAAPFPGSAHAAKWGDAYAQELDYVGGQVTSTSPNIMVAMLGSNDLSFLTSPEQTINNLRTYVQRARAAHPGIDVIVGEVVNRYDPWAGTYPNQAVTAEYASRLASFAIGTSTASERIIVARTRTGWDAKYHTWDGTHPNPTGETLIAQRVSEALASMGVGSSSPDIFKSTPWNVAGPSVGVAPGSAAAALSWSRVSTGATGMFIEQRLVNFNDSFDRLPYAVSGESWTSGGLIDGGTYQFRIVPSKGWNTGLSGPASAEVTVGGTTPGPISSISVSLGASGPQIDATWTASAGNAGYVVSYKDYGEQWADLPYPVQGQSWTFQAMGNGGLYGYYRVRGVRGFLSGPWKESAPIRSRGLAWDRAYVALGDSYSSGLGSASTSGGYAGGSCFRTTNAWPYQFQTWANSSIRHIACSGSWIADLYGQIDTMRNYYATVSKPKVVTVTIGGNDTQWAEFLGTCAMQDCTTMESQMRSRILSLRPGLANAYRAIKNAPEAKFADIVVGGYPVPVDPVNAASDTTSICAAFEMPEREMFARLTSSLNSVISGAASDAGVWSAAPYVQSRFRGHGACTYDAWLNDVDWDLGGDSQSGLIGPNSFHPTLGGQLAYALAFDDGFRAYSG